MQRIGFLITKNPSEFPYPKYNTKVSDIMGLKLVKICAPRIYMKYTDTIFQNFERPSIVSSLLF